MFEGLNLLLWIGTALILFAAALLFIQNQALRKRLEKASSHIFEQKTRFRHETEKRVSFLRTEIEKRERLIRDLKRELEKAKEQRKANQISDRIIKLTSERDVMSSELAQEEKLLQEDTDLGAEKFIKLKEELTKVKMERQSVKTLLSQYQKRYEDIMNWGTKLQKAHKDLSQRNKGLEEEILRLKKSNQELQARVRAPFS